MKPFKKILILGLLALLFFLVLVTFQLSKNLQIENVLTDAFFKSDTILDIEEINDITFTQMNTSKENQKEIKELLKGLELTRTDDSYSPLDANYRIVSMSNSDDQMYLFVDEKVIVFPHKGSRGYKIKNNDELSRLLKLF